jgi:hypothetical protein
MTQAELDGWLAQGKLDSRAQLYQDGWSTWRWAEEVYPRMRASAATGAGTAAAESRSAPVGAAAGAPTGAPRGPFQVNLGAPAAAATSPYSPLGGAFGFGATPLSGIRRWLRRTRGWVIFLAVLAFLMAAIIFVAMATMMIGAAAAGPFALVAGAMYGGEAVAFFVLAVMMVLYVTRIGAYLRNESLDNLQRALEAQQRLWMVAGILALIGVAMMGLFCLFFVFVGVQGMRM